MKPPTLLVGCVLLALTAPLWGQPVVVATSPENGSTGIAGPEVTIEIKFSEPMMTTSWSLADPGGGKAPEIIGEPFFPGPETCRITVGVEPGRVYALGLNTDARKGFISADGRRPLQPFVLQFETAGRGATRTSGRAATRSRGGHTDFRIAWREGETMQTTTVVERHPRLAQGEEAPGRFREVSVAAWQALETPGDTLQRVRHKLVRTVHIYEDPDTGETVREPLPVPGFVIEGVRRNGHWRPMPIGSDVDGDALRGFIGELMALEAFSPEEPVRQGEKWEVPGAHLMPLLMADPAGANQVTCWFTGIGDNEGEPTAEITHKWELEFTQDGVRFEADGKGRSVYLLDSRRFVSHNIELSYTVPRQRIPPGEKVSREGTVVVTQRLRYYPETAYPPLRPTGDSAAFVGGGLKPPPGPGAGRPPPPPKPAAENPLLGTWILQEGEAFLIFEWLPNGELRRVQHQGDETEAAVGKYELDVDSFTFIDSERGETTRIRFRLLGPDELQLTDPSGDAITLTRQREPE